MTATLRGSPTSTCTALALPLLSQISAATFSAASFAKSATTTFRPSAARPRNRSEQIPPAPPVTTIVLLICAPHFLNVAQLLTRKELLGEIRGERDRKSVV